MGRKERLNVQLVVFIRRHCQVFHQFGLAFAWQKSYFDFVNVMLCINVSENEREERRWGYKERKKKNED